MSATMDSQQAPGNGRARAKSSAFSFRSQGSDDHNNSSSPKSKHSRKVSDSERRKTHYDPTTKANPNAAMNEAQPIAAALEKPTLQSLRSFQHSDANGNLIAEPDLSNPTRSRWERPLDTIRSFEAAIDGEYRRRASQMRSDQTDVMSNYGGVSRRSSYYGGGQDAQRYSSNSYYGNQQNYGRPPRDSYDNGYGQGGPVGGPPRVRYGNRMQSDPGWGSQGGRMGQGQGQNVYGQAPPNGYQQSRDTVNTNGSNGSHSDGAYGTDPNSENSSIERSMPVRPPQGDMGDQYGASGYGGPIREEYGQQQAGYFPNQQQYGAPPPPPHAAKAVPPKAAPIRLGGGDSASPAGRPGVLRKESAGGEDKRRSWFKRRFSKD